MHYADCKHCGYLIRRFDTGGKWTHATGERGCRPALFDVDRDRWLANPPELHRRTATPERSSITDRLPDRYRQL